MKNHKLSGLPLDSAHIDGLSALFVHENLGIEMVMPAFVRYMAFVKDKIHPSKAYVDTTWLTENGRNWEWTNSRSPVRVVFNMTLWKIESWVDEKIDKHLTQSWRLVSKQNVLGATAKREKKKTVLYIQTNSLMNMIELIKKVLQVGKPPRQPKML